MLNSIAHHGGVFYFTHRCYRHMFFDIHNRRFAWFYPQILQPCHLPSQSPTAAFLYPRHLLLHQQVPKTAEVVVFFSLHALGWNNHTFNMHRTLNPLA